MSRDRLLSDRHWSPEDHGSLQVTYRSALLRPALWVTCVVCPVLFERSWKLYCWISPLLVASASCSSASSMRRRASLPAARLASQSVAQGPTRRIRIRPTARPRTSAPMTTSAFLSDVPAPPTRLNPTDEGFVHLDRPGQTVPARPDHRTSKLVQPRPCGSIAAQAEDSLQSQRAGAVLLADDPPDSSEPGHQRRARILEERAGGHRRLVPAAPAHPEPPPGAPRLSSLTGGTHESVRPPKSREVVAARFLRGEEGLELLKRPRIVLPYPGLLPVGATGVKGIPPKDSIGLQIGGEDAIGLWPTGSGSIVPGNVHQKHERPLFQFGLLLLLPVGRRQLRRIPRRSDQPPTSDRRWPAARIPSV